MNIPIAETSEAGPAQTQTAEKAVPPIFGAIATAVCAVLGVVGAVFHSLDFTSAQAWSIAACIGAYLAGGSGPTVNAVSSLRKGQLNVDLLMILAAIGAATIGDWIEGVVLLFLFSLSGTLEAFAMYRTTRSIELLIQLRPREALLVRDGVAEDQKVPVESLQIGDVVRVRLSLAATVEQLSEHPLGVPVVAEVRRRGIALSESPLGEFHSHTGLGVHARVEGIWVGVGREGLFETHDIAIPDELIEQAQRIRERGQTALLVLTVEESLCGVIGVADQIRPEAATTMDGLKRLGIHKIVILTGDHERVALSISKLLHAEVRAGLLPDQKVVELQRLAEAGGLVAMVGDGVNDAPALAAASVGIAMGGAGTDVALEVADVVLMSDDLRALPLAVWISRLARKRVRQNMIFAFSMIGILVISTFFDLPLWLGVLGHEGSTVAVVFNGLRLLWEKTPTLT